MPLEYFVHLIVGLIHVIYNYDNIWTMRNLHTLLGAQQGFRHELATKLICISHSFKNKESCDLDVVATECRLSVTIDLESLTDTCL